MKIRVVSALFGAFAMTACASAPVYVTSMGPLRVADLPDMHVQVPLAGESTETTLVARQMNGRPVPFEARAAALEALEAHCLEQDFGAVPYFFGWRDTGQGYAWTAAGCRVISIAPEMSPTEDLAAAE